MQNTTTTPMPGSREDSLNGIRAAVLDLQRIAEHMDEPDKVIDGQSPRKALSTAILALEIIHSDLSA